MKKSLNKFVVGGLILLVLLVSSYLVFFQTIFFLDTDSVSWNGLTYKCNDDLSPLSDDEERVGCRLCAMNDLSFDGVSSFGDLRGVAQLGDGDCVQDYNSAKNRWRYVWGGYSPSSSKSGLNSYYEDNNFVGYVGVVKSKFVAWSLEYDYCPLSGVIANERLGACNVPPPINTTPVCGDGVCESNESCSADCGIVPGVSNIPLWYWIVGVLALSSVGLLVWLMIKK